MKKKLRYLDLFAGAGGLSEGFIRTGFIPVAHVESDTAACFTLKTRMAFHWLNSNGGSELYSDYLSGKISRNEFYKLIPDELICSIINKEINRYSLSSIFKEIDDHLNGSSLDMIIGGPPCQAYSLVGRSRDKNRMKGDKRNYLYKYYAEFLNRYRPCLFVFENVTGLYSARDMEGNLYFDNMLNLFRNAGYETEYMTLSAEDYGVPQCRKRIILVGRRGKKSGFYPQLKRWETDVTIKEIFSDLPRIKAGEGGVGPCKLKKYNGSYLYDAHIRNDRFPVTWHQARPNTKQDLEIYRIVVDHWNKSRSRFDYNILPERLKTHNNRDTFTDRFKIVASELKSAQTVVAHIAKDGHYYIHPDIEQNRSITPREAARLQAFPDDYFFESISGVPQRTHAFRQIGNAVPVLLASKIAEKLREVW